MQSQIAVITLIMFEALNASPSNVARLKCFLGDDPPRVFRLAPGVLQEWNSLASEYGENLCDILRCSSNKGRLTASIESASLIFTIEFEQGSRIAKWKTVGASGRKQTEGECSVEPETAVAKHG